MKRYEQVSIWDRTHRRWLPNGGGEECGATPMDYLSVGGSSGTDGMAEAGNRCERIANHGCQKAYHSARTTGNRRGYVPPSDRAWAIWGVRPGDNGSRPPPGGGGGSVWGSSSPLDAIVEKECNVGDKTYALERQANAGSRPRGGTRNYVH